VLATRLKVSFLSCATAVATAAAGCGGTATDTTDDAARAVVQGRVSPEHAAAVERDPYRITCGDLARQHAHSTNVKLVLRTEFALAEDPALRPVVAKETRNRVGRSVYFGLVEECKGRPEDFRPARGAVAGVRVGRYLAARNRPG
jgi:hypothetical protein